MSQSFLGTFFIGLLVYGSALIVGGWAVRWAIGKIDDYLCRVDMLQKKTDDLTRDVTKIDKLIKDTLKPSQNRYDYMDLMTIEISTIKELTKKLNDLASTIGLEWKDTDITLPKWVKKARKKGKNNATRHSKKQRQEVQA